ERLSKDADKKNLICSLGGTNKEKEKEKKKERGERWPNRKKTVVALDLEIENNLPHNAYMKYFGRNNLLHLEEDPKLKTKNTAGPSGDRR
ncbi:unnamed protein product, partial [Linum tenue]